MKAIFKIENPNELQATMSITMAICEWKELRDQLAQRWPSSSIALAVSRVINEAEKSYYATEKNVM